MKNADLKKRILDISFKKGLSHIGSCITAVDIIDEIFKTKGVDEKFVLSSGHAGLALYVVLEKYIGLDAEEIFDHHGVHPDRCETCHIDCSSGSLGQGLPIAVGMALTDRRKNVYCLTSDGEWAEGSMWEALRVYNELDLNNLKIYLNFNGWAAYQRTKIINMPHEVKTYYQEFEFSFLNGQDAHYHALTEEEYKEGVRLCESDL